MNLILLTDSYKVTHWKQYPPGTTNVYSYFESRGGPLKKLVFFGLQYLLKKYFSSPITEENILEARKYFANHFYNLENFNEAGWRHIIEKHKGLLPISIKAQQEGTLHEPLDVLMTVENTCPECFWVTNYVETLLVQLWYPITVASMSFKIRRMIADYMRETCDTFDGIQFKLHDFGFRGASSVETSAIGGAAHLLNFKGSDTLPALTLIHEYYDNLEAAQSIPAAEHSTITSWGRNNEQAAYLNMIEKFGSEPFFAVVSDSYDIFNACKNIWGGTLKEKVLELPGTLVIRPDSGMPHLVVMQCLNLLESRFGSTKNEKGFKLLPPRIRLIWGDGLDQVGIYDIMNTMKTMDWSIDNISFGMGGGLLQKINRDTLRFAFKCSNITVNGENRPVRKQPISDRLKVSKCGRFDHLGLHEVFRDGQLLQEVTFRRIKERLSAYLWF